MATTLLTENRRNLAANPRAATSTAGWAVSAGTGGVAALSQQGADGPATFIPTFARATWTVGSSAVGGGVTFGAATAGTYAIPVTPGTLVSVSASGRCSKAQLLALNISWYSAAGALLSTTAGGAQLVTAATWTPFSLAGQTVPAGAAAAVLLLSAVTGTGAVTWAAGDTLDVTAAMAVTGTDTGSYFDGSSPSGGPTSYAWTGVVNASASVEYALAAVTIPTPGFTPGSSILWGLGDYDDPDLQFNGVDSFGVEWICGTPEGWKTSTTDVPLLDNPGDGAQFSPGRRKPRTLTIRGAFRCADITAMDAAEDRLRLAVEHYVEDTTLWHGPLPTGSVAKQMTVRLAGDLVVAEVDANPRIRTFTAVLVAGDPLKYAAGVAGLITVPVGMAPPAGDLPGVTFPMQFPMDFGGGNGFAGRATLFNPGNQPGWPTTVFTLTSGTLDTPVLRHLGLGVAAGVARVMQTFDVITLDHRSRLVAVNGSAVFAQRIDGCTFFPLAPGANDLFFTATDFNPTATASISFRPSWS